MVGGKEPGVVRKQDIVPSSFHMKCNDTIVHWSLVAESLLQFEGVFVMDPQRVVVRFNREQVAEQTEGNVRRISGFVQAKNLLTLFDAADLEANPRSAKAGSVTDSIIESIQDTPDTFPFKTKGILVGAADYQRLERDRYELRFENPEIEGILDGGHNMLAIGTYILSLVLQDDRAVRKIKVWSDFKDAWIENRDSIEELRTSNPESDLLSFLVPVEILVPSDLNDDLVRTEFLSSLLDICAARNNNVELRAEAKANQKGYYEDLKSFLDDGLANRIEWKTNDGGTIRVRDLLALSWIPLSLVDMPVDEDNRPIDPPVPQNIYRNKGECVTQFDRLMSSPAVTSPQTGEYRHVLTNQQVISALRITAKLPELYDKIYQRFPAAYNNGQRRFGRLKVVKMAEDMKSKPTTHFGSAPVKFSYPDGMIMPLVYGLQKLITRNADGTLRWATDPVLFLDQHFDAIVEKYVLVISAFDADPQKIGKNETSYKLALDHFETEMLRAGIK
jgi:hypothetical protein